MRYEKQNGTTHIYVENGETEQQVLRAIVKASFKLARPAGMGWLHHNDSQQMTDEIADQYIMREPHHKDDKTVIRMDYVEGRQCMTRISRIEVGHFTLSNSIYEPDRGIPDPMLDMANHIIVAKENTGHALSSHMYKGESLTLRLKEYGFTRTNGEGDWDFRKRLFPDMYKISSDRAMEFLLGSSATEWDELDKVLYMLLLTDNKGNPNRFALERFVNGFAADPLVMHEERKVGHAI